MRHIDAVCILSKGRDAADVWATIRGVWSRHRVQFKQGSLVILNDFEDRGVEPEEVGSEEKAVSRITAWPTFGGIEYELDGQKITVFAFGILPRLVDAITISANATPHMTNAAFRGVFDALVMDIHVALEAARTICDYEVLSPNSVWVHELERVRNRVYEGTYALDLR